MPSPDVFGLHCAKGRDVNAEREQFKHAEGSRQKHAKKLVRGNESKRDRSNFFRVAHLDLAWSSAAAGRARQTTKQCNGRRRRWTDAKYPHVRFHRYIAASVSGSMLAHGSKKDGARGKTMLWVQKEKGKRERDEAEARRSAFIGCAQWPQQ